MVVLNLESKRISARRVRDYTKAFCAFVSFCALHGLTLPMELAKEPQILSENLGKFIEHLYAQRGSFTHAKYAVLSVKSFGSPVA